MSLIGVFMFFSEVATVDEIPEGNLRHFEVSDHEILVARVGGNFYAASDRCPHMNARLSLGTLDGTTIICPLHYARFDLTTGMKLSGPVFKMPRGVEDLPKNFQEYFEHVTMLLTPVKTYNLEIYQ